MELSKLSWLAAFALMLLSSCRATQPSGGSVADVPFSVARNYFVNNSVEQLPSAPITSREQFDRFFGAAAVMGKDGQPTPIDFSRQYVIAVAKPASDRQVSLDPVSLQSTADGRLRFAYRTVMGRSLSYSSRPCLVIIVDAPAPASILFNEDEY